MTYGRLQEPVQIGEYGASEGRRLPDDALYHR